MINNITYIYNIAQKCLKYGLTVRPAKVFRIEIDIKRVQKWM